MYASKIQDRMLRLEDGCFKLQDEGSSSSTPAQTGDCVLKLLVQGFPE
jgi:hypothetical protein